MTPQRQAFDEYAADYDRWFDENPAVFPAELHMLNDAVPRSGCGLEIGVGSGRFAAALGIGYGIDPSRRLLMMAKGRGIDGIEGEGEHLPFREGAFRTVLMMTVICFLQDPLPVFREAGRVLADGGSLVVGFIEKDGETETAYRNEKTKGRFLRFARFRTVDDVLRYFGDGGFSEITTVARARGFCVVRGTKHRD